MSYYISRMKNIDIKGNGSKNYGASNTLALAGVKAGILVFLHDFAKGYLSVIIASAIFQESLYAGLIAGCFAIVGHIFPFYLHFNGGKGYASFIGVSFALFPLQTVCIALASLMLVYVTDYIVASTFSTITVMPIVAMANDAYVESAALFAMAILIFVKHRKNIENLVLGKESKVSESLRHRINQEPTDTESH